MGKGWVGVGLSWPGYSQQDIVGGLAVISTDNYRIKTINSLFQRGK